MGLMDKLKGEFIDIVEFLDNTNNTIAHRFDRYNNEIKNGAKLVVREGQVAVFINEGQLADVFNPGTHELTTQNMPILSTLKGWKYGFNSPFKAEVYFISNRRFTDQKWGTKNPIIMNDDRCGMIEVRAFGNYVFKVKDPKLFIKEIVGTDGNFTNDKINEQLRTLIVTRFTDAVGEAKIPIEAFAGQINEVSALVQERMKEDFEKYGIEIIQLLIENLSMPDDIKKEIFEYSRLNKIDLNKLAQMKMAKSFEKAAENQGGTAGAGMGMGMGFAMAGQMGSMFNQQQQGQPQQQSGGGAPPPIPGAVKFFIAMGGQQQGPYDLAALSQMAASNQLTKETLVWKDGMPSWIAAGQVGELTSVFGSVPPPIPGK
jgi:membrane protease subunit (stomatin/prohibitin family)